MPSSMLTRKSVQESKQLKGGSLRCGSDAKSLYVNRTPIQCIQPRDLCLLK